MLHRKNRLTTIKATWSLWQNNVYKQETFCRNMKTTRALYRHNWSAAVTLNDSAISPVPSREHLPRASNRRADRSGRFPMCTTCSTTFISSVGVPSTMYLHTVLTISLLFLSLLPSTIKVKSSPSLTSAAIFS